MLLAERCGRDGLSKVDKNLLTTLVNGVIRLRLSLDTVISFFSKIPVNKIEPWTMQALRLGLYQIIYLDKIPASAAVNTSVELVKKLTHRTDAAKFTNAVLRSAERSILNKSAQKSNDPHKELYRRENSWCEFQQPIFPDPDRQPALYLAVQHSHPEWLVKRWLDRYGKEKSAEICKTNNLPPKLFLRINQKKISVQKFIALLDKEGIRSRDVDGAVAVDDTAVSAIPGFVEGLFYVQDVSAMKTACFLRAEASNHVLDMCAAPGGKAIHIAELVGDAGRVYAMDISLKRLQLVKENCRRMGIHTVFAVCADASNGKAPFRANFDRILIDAPCSNTGVFSRRPEARWRIKEDDIGALAALQYAILETGASLLKCGGVMVYSTCSIEPEENQKLIEQFIRNRPQFYLDGEEYYTPDAHAGDGGYMARICKRSSWN